MGEVGDVDLYAILGVKEDVTDDELKKVFRKLVLKFHPDKNKDNPQAAEKFSEVTLANDVLSDPVKRAQYDSRKGMGGAKEDDVLINISLKESATGCTRLAHVGTWQRCKQCRGIGAICPPCGDCEGTRVRSTGTVCTSCEGRGFKDAVSCGTCKGKGQYEELGTARVEIPAGANTGHRIPLLAKRGREVRVNVLPSRVFQRTGLDVKSILQISSAEWEEGGPVEVETLYGKDMIMLEPKLPQGTIHTLEGKGLPSLDSKTVGNHQVCIQADAAKKAEKVHESWAADSTNTTEVDEGVESKGEKRPLPSVASQSDGAEEKKSKKEDEDNLARLLAEKKRALLASLGL
eukprot:CAMPEP_0196600634 /NCGR_PEP_ID=MMETSP1081-20130531/95491_1 /TAXON_ID=36882 /ORGANISM="Pyramimonas amylifera, Strain CCMP720" /LENGTH=346 /DNA_ID=CAMNT_0041926481 /DNA_START=40 /DNA_END=1080 /DNA_ORIENTATION=-